MKVLLEIKDNKAAFVMELLESLPFVKAKKLTNSKAEILQDIKSAVEEVQEAKAGRKRLRTLKEGLDEISFSNRTF